MEYVNQQRRADEMTDVLCGPAGDVTFDGAVAVEALGSDYVKVQHPMGGCIGFGLGPNVNAEAVAGQLAGVIAAWVEAANRYHVEVTGCGPTGTTQEAVAGDATATHREPVTAPESRYPIVSTSGQTGIVWLAHPNDDMQLIYTQGIDAAAEAVSRLTSWVSAWCVDVLRRAGADR